MQKGRYHRATSAKGKLRYQMCNKIYASCNCVFCWSFNMLIPTCSFACSLSDAYCRYETAPDKQDPPQTSFGVLWWFSLLLWWTSLTQTRAPFFQY